MALERIGAQPHRTATADEVLVTFLDTDTGLTKNVLLRGDAELYARFADAEEDPAERATACFDKAETLDAARKTRNQQDEASKPVFPIQEGRKK